MILVWPCGIDADVRHRPWTTLAMVGICALATLAIWFRAPFSILFGPIWVCQAERIAEAERLAAEPEPAWEELGGRLAAGSATAAVALPGLEESPDPARTFPLLERALGLEPGGSLRLTDEDRLELIRSIDLYSGPGHITQQQRAELHRRVEAAPAMGVAWNELRARVSLGEGGRRAVSVDKRDLLAKELTERLAGKGISQAEYDELARILDGWKVVSATLDESQVDPEDIPWFMMAYGGSADPIAWIASLFVHVHWRDALLGIALLWSFGLAVEGRIGWRLFLPLAAAFGLVAGAVTWLCGLSSPVVLVACGNAGLLAGLAGILLAIAPLSHIRYQVWFFMPVYNFSLPVWFLQALSLVAGPVLAWLVGLPALPAVLQNLAMPLLGLGAGTLALRKGWADGQGWDLFSLWRTRGLLATERNRLEAERRTQARPGAQARTGGTSGAPGAQPPSPAGDPPWLALAREGEASIAEDLAAGRAEDAWQVVQMGRRSWPAWRPPAPLLDRMMKALWSAKAAEAAGACAILLAELHPEHAAEARLVAAAVAITHARKPKEALKHLDAIAEGALKEPQRRQAEALRRKAQEEIAKQPASGYEIDFG